MEASSSGGSAFSTDAARARSQRSRAGSEKARHHAPVSLPAIAGRAISLIFLACIITGSTSRTAPAATVQEHGGSGVARSITPRMQDTRLIQAKEPSKGKPEASALA
jgi:hypothetical protein